MSDKKSFVLRIDNETYKALEKWAADEFRSVNGQIEWILSQKLKEAGRIKDPASNAAKTANKKNI
ncbi:MAG: Arc family DNA-binding protein [Chitinophagaceae bacterium]|nr:Arc family DNA-binding protein [Chitinophagaceae bacterium]